MTVSLCGVLFPCRGFNDAINGFSDDGWSMMNTDGAEDVIIAVNSSKNLGGASNPSNSLSLLGGVLCAKASMLLQVSYQIIAVDVWSNLLFQLTIYFCVNASLVTIIYCSMCFPSLLQNLAIKHTMFKTELTIRWTCPLFIL